MAISEVAPPRLLETRCCNCRKWFQFYLGSVPTCPVCLVVDQVNQGDIVAGLHDARNTRHWHTTAWSRKSEEKA